jgi:Tfp pilus assembly protein PilP
MKPNFALTLSFDGIGLLHRAPAGWHLVGEVALADPDVAGALSVLRRTAVQLDSAGLRSKIVIPNEQIRYLSLPAPARDADSAAHVAAALDGATPYAVADLRFDWITVGTTLHIAAVALETLQEAETFADEHGFAPVSLVATPAPDSFPGEPFFGLTKAAAQLIDPSDRLMRDTHAIRILGRADLPAPVPQAGTPDSTPPDDTPQSDRTADATAAPDAPPLPAFSSRRTTKPPDTSPDTSEADELDQHIVAGSASVPAIEPENTAPIGAAQTNIPPATVSKQQPPSLADNPPLVTGQVPTDDRPVATIPTDPAPSSAPVPAPVAPPIPKPAAFRSPPAAPSGPNGRAIRSSTSGKRAKAANRFAAMLGRMTRRPSKPNRPTPDTKSGQQGADAAAVQPVTPGISASEKQRLTIFGARKAQVDAATPRATPRFMGLILTGCLLLFLAGLAAWSSTVSDMGLRGLFGGKDQTRIVDLPAAAVPGGALDNTAPLSPDLPEAIVDLARLDGGAALSDLSQSDLSPDDLTTDDLTLAAPDPAAEAEPQIAPDSAPELFAAEDQAALAGDTPLDPAAELDAARSSYAATGIWLVPPAQPDAPSSDTLDDLYIASIDGRLQNFDAVALPIARATSADMRPAAQSSPAAPGTRFDLDDRGLVTATPDGAETPDGIMVFAGRPAVTPEGMPTRFAATPRSDAQPEPSLSALSAIRPLLRPDNLAESNERAQLGGLSRNELAGMRPRARPDTLAAVALALREADEAEAAADEADAFDSATEQAIATSLKPLARPRDFASTVDSTRQAQQPPQQQPQAQPQQQVASAATLAPQRNAAPQIPSSASVAQQATVRGALNLRQVNLIGVYGQPSNRRALVRLSNGRYQKVQVGDRLDGGRVRAIGESELSYVKGNRSIVLTMPRG